MRRHGRPTTTLRTQWIELNLKLPKSIRGPFHRYLIAMCERCLDRLALAHPGFWAASAAILFTPLALGVVEGVLPLHLARRLDQPRSASSTPAVALLVASSAAIATRFTPRRVVHSAALLITTGLALAGAIDTVWLWIAALLLTGAPSPPAL